MSTSSRPGLRHRKSHLRQLLAIIVLHPEISGGSHAIGKLEVCEVAHLLEGKLLELSIDVLEKLLVVCWMEDVLVNNIIVRL